MLGADSIPSDKRHSARRFLVFAVRLLITTQVGTGCVGQYGTTSSGGPTSPSTPGSGQPSYTRKYCAAAVSGGFDRNDQWSGIVCGTNLQGTINQAHSDCERASGTLCEDAFWCGSPDLTPRTPFIAYARVSVFAPSFIDRGASGFVCGYSDALAAGQRALDLCGRASCDVWSVTSAY
jgi:hypothetical protein